jgi:hypothetical protein
MGITLEIIMDILNVISRVHIHEAQEHHLSLQITSTVGNDQEWG